MYQKIMVPLDGSELAECVLPHVEAITSGCRVSNEVQAWLPWLFEGFAIGT